MSGCLRTNACRLPLASAPLLLVGALMAMPSAAFDDRPRPPAYSAPETAARVLDEQTGAPIEGVVVLAQWKLTQETLGGGAHDYHKIHTFETVTDRDVRFVIPAWGPSLRPPYSYLTRSTPELRIFKPGYFPQILANRYAVLPESSVVVSDWNDKTIALKAFDGDWIRYAQGLSSLWGMRSDECVRLCPRLILATDAEWRRIRPSLPQRPDLHGGPFPLYTLDVPDRAALEDVLGGPLPGGAAVVIKKRSSSSSRPSPGRGKPD